MRISSVSGHSSSSAGKVEKGGARIRQGAQESEDKEPRLGQMFSEDRACSAGDEIPWC